MFASRAAAEGGSDMKVHRLAGPHAFRLLVGIVTLLAVFAAGRTSWADSEEFRWDIINVDFATSTLSSGGVASAKAVDGSTITLTGSGAFDTDHAKHVSGGGTWTTESSSGAQTGTGTYEVTRLVSFIVAPGTSRVMHDNIGNLADQRAGLAVLQIEYNDESRGVLIVSCDLVGTPGPVVEGITASKDFIDYYVAQTSMPPVNTNHTNFHVLDDARGD
jgi:hypothetical protein